MPGNRHHERYSAPSVLGRIHDEPTLGAGQAVALLVKEGLPLNAHPGLRLVHPLEVEVPLLPDYLNFGLIAILLLVLLILAVAAKSTVYIPNNRVGIIEKLFSGRGSVKSGFIALAGEAGYQPEVLRGGWHVFMPVPVPRPHDAPGHHPPGQDRLRVRPRRPAAARHPDPGLATSPPTISRTSPASCRNGGQRGPQRQILREGTYAINLAQFVVITEDRASSTCRLAKSEETTFQKHGAPSSQSATASSRW